MKVVLFCGGKGLRLRGYDDMVPKPMVRIGNRPILWHVMKYYAHFGHKEFILCLGYKADTIKDYFLHYDECVSNNFTLSQGGKKIELAHKDIDDWKITFVDTGLNTIIGQRLKAVEKYLGEDEMFLANYSDNLTDFYLPSFVEQFKQSKNLAGFISVKPSHSFHVVNMCRDGRVSKIRQANEADIWLNGGYFILRREIFNYLRTGEELVVEPFSRLIEENKLMTFRHKGFWACMDTFKEKQQLEDLASNGDAFWKVWQRHFKEKEAEVEGCVKGAKEELVNA